MKRPASRPLLAFGFAALFVGVSLTGGCVAYHPTPTRAPLAPADAWLEHYRLMTGDVMILEVDDGTWTSRVDAAGNISFRGADINVTAKVVGLTLGEALQAVAKALAAAHPRYALAPDVSLGIAPRDQLDVTIQGEVNAPGRYPISKDKDGFTVFDLIMKAGGFTDVSNGRRVQITSFDSLGNDSTRIVDCDVTIGPRHERSDPADYVLKPGDIIFVPTLKL